MAHIQLSTVTIDIDRLPDRFRFCRTPNSNGKKYTSDEMTLGDLERLLQMLSGVIGGTKHDGGRGRPRGPYKKRETE